MKKLDFKGSVVLNPVPVVLVTSKNKEGKVNVFTVAWAGTVCTKPPMLSISIRPERLSYEYIKETMEFTVNLPNVKLVKETDFCGVRSGRNIDKVKEMGFEMVDGRTIDVPYINQCPVSIECKVRDIIHLGTHDLFIGEVTGSNIDENLLDDTGKIHFEWANLINYAHGEYYPMSKRAIGGFGYSVAKNPKIKEKYEGKHKKEIKINQENKGKPQKKKKKYGKKKKKS